MNAAADGSVAEWGVEACLNDILGFGLRTDHGGDDAEAAVVENTLDVVVFAGGDAGQGDAAGVGDGGHHVRCRFHPDQGMLNVNRQPIPARTGHEPGGGDAPQGKPGADRRLTRLEHSFDRVRSHAPLA